MISQFCATFLKLFEFYFEKGLHSATEGQSPLEPTSSPMSTLRPLKTKYVREYCVPAVRGFFRSVSLAHGSSLQDTLRILTLWFEDGQHQEVYEALAEGIKTVPIETWLQVLFLLFD